MFYYGDKVLSPFALAPNKEIKFAEEDHNPKQNGRHVKIRPNLSFVEYNKIKSGPQKKEGKEEREEGGERGKREPPQTTVSGLKIDSVRSQDYSRWRLVHQIRG